MSSAPPDPADASSGRGGPRPRRQSSLARRTGAGVVVILLITLTAFALFAGHTTRALTAESASRNTTAAWSRAAEQLASLESGTAFDAGATADEPHVPGTHGQREGTVVALVSPADLEDHQAGTIRGHRVGKAGESVPLDARQSHEIIHAIRGEPIGAPVDAEVSGEGYRFKALPMTSPGPWVGADQLLVVGVPTGALTEISRRGLLMVVLGLSLTVVVTALAVFLWLRRGLAPLGEVAAMAERVAGMDLAHTGIDRRQTRMPKRLLQGPDEVVMVAEAMDRFTGAVEDALEERRRQEQQLRSFIADASHELRTPLASVRGYAEMIAMTEDLSETGRRSLDRVLHQAGRMSALVDDMLLLERLESVSRGRAVGLAPSGEVPAADPVDLPEVLLEAVVDARAAWPDHQWVLDLPETLGEEGQGCVTGDPAQLARLVGNLLSNGAKHTPAGTTVTASLRIGRPLPHQVVVSVHDDGGGIPAEQRERLFERFARGASAGGPGREPSTGLGLAIVRSIARSHGGEASVVSEAGWTRFDVVLPCARWTARAQAEAAGRGGPEAPEGTGAPRE